MEIHNITPVYNENSRLLLLGSFPSVRSRQDGFFYAHPHNRFWRVLAAIYACQVPVTIDDKRALLLDHGVALWDVIAACEIDGSSDASITDVVVNDVEIILKAAPIKKVFCNGGKAHEMYRRYLQPRINREAIRLPSTSPANAAWSLERLTETWRMALI